MKKLAILITSSVLFIFCYAPFALSKEPFLYQKDKKILPAYEGGEFNETQRLSIYVASLINQGRLDKAAQILNISGPQKAAAILLTINLKNAQYLLNSLDVKNVTSTFAQIARLNANYAGMLLEAIARRNPSLAAKLYKTLAKERAILTAVFKTVRANNEKMLTSLLTAKSKKARYIISTNGARQLLSDYAQANERDEWGDVEISVLINSGRGAEILFRRLTQKGILELTDEERMKVLLSMKPEEAAKIIKDAHPYQAARILVMMKPLQAARILAQKVLKPKKVKRIIKEMYKQDKNITADILKELEVLAPLKVEKGDRLLFKH